MKRECESFMNESDFLLKYNKYKNTFIDYSQSVFSKVKTDNLLAEAMKYSFFAGGKRVRPVLMLACTEHLNGEQEKVLPFAFSLECLHTYSLIHDDLPALDNDVLRRGNPTCHMKFDEATAILAGDGLLNFAFEHTLSVIKDKRDIKCAKLLAEYAGYSGMLGGQKSDIEHEGCTVKSIEELNSIYDRKTGKFMTLPFLIPAELFNSSECENAKAVGVLLGRAFQYNDDLLDLSLQSLEVGKSIGKDEKEKKYTSVFVLSQEKVKKLLTELRIEIEDKVKTLIDVEFFNGFMNFLFSKNL